MLRLVDLKDVRSRSGRDASRTGAPEKLDAEHSVAPDTSGTTWTARAYDYAGDGYSRYADGEGAAEHGAPEGRFAHADTIVWEAICRSLDELREAGVTTVRVLDAGCGPGVWTKRIAEYAHNLGLRLVAVGFDISAAQLEMARKHAAVAMAAHRTGAAISLEFMEHDLAQPLPWPDRHFHIVLCNYAVLNHLDKRTLPAAIGELCRVASDCVIATARAVGSPATACIVGTEQVASYRHDPNHGQLALVLKDGSRHQLSFNVYPAGKIKSLFAPHADIVDLRAMDLFLSRFASDQNWTASLVSSLPERATVEQELKDLESALCRSPGWIDHGTHLLVVARPRSANSANHTQPAAAPNGKPVATSFAEFLASRPK